MGCLIELKLCEVSRNSFSNWFWKFQLSILKNKKVLFLKKYFLSCCQYQNKSSFVYWLNFQGWFWNYIVDQLWIKWRDHNVFLKKDKNLKKIKFLKNIHLQAVLDWLSILFIFWLCAVYTIFTQIYVSVRFITFPTIEWFRVVFVRKVLKATGAPV